MSDDFKDGFEVEAWTDDTIPEKHVFIGRLEEVKKRVVNFTNDEGDPDSFTLAVWWFKIDECPDFVNRDGERVDGETLVGRKVRYECDPRTTMHPDNKMRLCMEALMAASLEAGMRVHPDDFVGLPAKLTVKHREFTNKDGEKRIAMDVDNVMRALGPEEDLPF